MARVKGIRKGTLTQQAHAFASRLCTDIERQSALGEEIVEEAFAKPQPVRHVQHEDHYRDWVETVDARKELLGYA